MGWSKAQKAFPKAEGAEVLPKPSTQLWVDPAEGQKQSRPAAINATIVGVWMHISPTPSHLLPPPPAPAGCQSTTGPIQRPKASQGRLERSLHGGPQGAQWLPESLPCAPQTELFAASRVPRPCPGRSPAKGWRDASRPPVKDAVPAAPQPPGPAAITNL